MFQPVNEETRGFQRIYSRDGSSLLVDGWWDPKVILSILERSLGANSQDFWRGKKVIDIGANTCGLSIEIARRGANVVAIEPDIKALNRYQRIAKDIEPECLKLEVRNGVLEDVIRSQESSDVILFLGLLYHFKYPHFIIQSLASLRHRWLFLSTQCTDKSGLLQVNRLEEMPDRLRVTMNGMTGWHLSRDLLFQSLLDAGYNNINEGSDPLIHFKNKPASERHITNTTYICATRESFNGATKDIYEDIFRYYPR